MDRLSFSPIEKTVSFYTRNDFAILNRLLIGDYDGLWQYALLAYRDNQGILDEYESGVRAVRGDYDVKWINCLRERLVGQLDDGAKRKIIAAAQDDISNILGAMAPAKERLSLFRTAWVSREGIPAGTVPYSREYPAVLLTAGGIFAVETISSYSLTPYREEDDVGSDFYRYELCVPAGKNVLPLDPFISHNENGEVLLPPMKCRVTGIRGSENERCRGIIALEYLEQLQVVRPQGE